MPRDLKLTSPRMNGDDVKAWQRRLMADGENLAPWNDDGDFGPLTEARTIHWQAARGLLGKPPAVSAGVVDEGTRTCATVELVPLKPSTDALEEGVFIQAKNFSHWPKRTTIAWIVVHSMEAAERPDAAEAVAAWFAGQRGPAPRASAHCTVDSDSIVRCVAPLDIAFAAMRTGNNLGYHCELDGRAKQTREDWLDEFSTSMLKIAARHLKAVALRFDVPIEFVDAEGLKAGRRGFTGHRDISFAFRESTHVDPGEHFPWDVFLEMVRAA